MITKTVDIIYSPAARDRGRRQYDTLQQAIDAAYDLNNGHIHQWSAIPLLITYHVCDDPACLTK